MDFPHFQGKRCEGGAPVTPERLQEIREAAQGDGEHRLMLRELLDEVAIHDRASQNKPGVPPEYDRRIRELESLVAGLTTEVSQVYEKMEDCAERMGEMLLLVKRLDARDRRRVRAIEDLTAALTLPHNEVDSSA